MYLISDMLLSIQDMIVLHNVHTYTPGIELHRYYWAWCLFKMAAPKKHVSFLDPDT